MRVQAIFLELLQLGYEIQKIDLSHCATGTEDIQAKKKDRPAMMAIKGKGNKLSVLPIGTVSRLPARFPLPIPMIPISMNQPSKHLRLPMFRIVL